MIVTNLKADYNTYKESALYGRYITADHIKNLLIKHSNYIEISVLGKSVLKTDLHFIKIGSGEKRILMWSQMHGNESTTTKAVFDLLNTLVDVKNEYVKKLLATCTIGIIPMLNPDGAKAYTRLNANDVDLNRDAQQLSQPESKALRACFDAFKPHYCFNLHGQRTIFSAGPYNKPATMSFLAPAEDEACSVTLSRKRAMEVIVKINEGLQQVIPHQVGTYDDAFNINCVGDTFQTLNIPTILFEAGHYANDYDREEVRALVYQSLRIGLNSIAFDAVNGVSYEAYAEIPQNEKLFYDILIRNGKLKKGNSFQVSDIGVLYQEKLGLNKINFIPKIEKIGDLSNCFGHRELDANGELVFSEGEKELKENDSIDFVFINNVKHLLNLEIN